MQDCEIIPESGNADAVEIEQRIKRTLSNKQRSCILRHEPQNKNKQLS